MADNIILPEYIRESTVCGLVWTAKGKIKIGGGLSPNLKMITIFSSGFKDEFT